MKRAIFAAVLGMGLTLSPVSGYALSAADQAVFQKGVDLYDLGQYREAYDIWQTVLIEKTSSA